MAAAEVDVADPAFRKVLRTLAESAARAGGEVARELFRNDYDVRMKADRSEVSEADEKAQQAIVECIRAARPDDAFITEERVGDRVTLPTPTRDQVCWVIDPIDGTRNYVRHLPVYACSVAAMLDGRPIVGAVGDPQQHTVYSGACGDGLYINGSPCPPIDASSERGLNPKPVVAIPSSPGGPSRDLAHRWLDRFICRNFGPTTLHLAWIAAGELDGLLADNPRLWDLAAGCLLIEESGGRVVRLDGSALFPIDVATYANEPLAILAARAHVYDQLRQV